MRILLLLFVLIALLVVATSIGNINGKFQTFVTNIDDATTNNTLWRRVLNTTKNQQLVAMSVPPGEELGWEIHPDTDQFFRVEEGTGVLYTKPNTSDDADSFPLKADSAAVVPMGTYHNFANSGDNPLKFYTIYSPPHHPDGTVDKTRADELTRH